MGDFEGELSVFGAREGRPTAELWDFKKDLGRIINYFGAGGDLLVLGIGV